MKGAKRVFIFGAGFSKPAKMPLATEWLPLLTQKPFDDEMSEWLDGLSERLNWLSGTDSRNGPFRLNIEEVFHYAHFDVEVIRLRQHLASVGRHDGPSTSWNVAQAITKWLLNL
jgi:hypothetical protein